MTEMCKSCVITCEVAKYFSLSERDKFYPAMTDVALTRSIKIQYFHILSNLLILVMSRDHVK